MILTKNSVGVEICGSDLRLAVMRMSFGKLRLTAIHRIAGFMTQDEEARKKAVKTLVKKNSIPVSRVYLSVPREHGIVRQIDLPAEMAQKLADVVKLQVETLSPWPLDEIYWDFAQEQQKRNRKLTAITIVIIPRTALDPWIAFFKSAGAPLSGATLSSLAYGHGATALWKEAGPTVILRREESYIEGVVVNGSRIAALTVPPADGPGATKTLMDRLLSVAKLPSAEGSRFVLCGDSSDPASLEENPHLPIENTRPQSTADFGAIAAALLPLKESPFRSNLVPPAQRYHESQLRLIPTYVLGFLVICVGLGLVAREPYQSVAYASRIDTEIRKIAPQVSEVANQEAELNQLSTRSRALASALQNGDYNLEAVRELARVLPATTFLASYAYQSGTITISGFAQSASEIQSLLENSSMFKGVEFTNSVMREPNGKDRFTLKMVVEVSQ
jgi:Tfp pilus assembly protein PilN